MASRAAAIYPLHARLSVLLKTVNPGLTLGGGALALLVPAVSGLTLDATGIALADSVAGTGLDITGKVLSVD